MFRLILLYQLHRVREKSERGGALNMYVVGHLSDPHLPLPKAEPVQLLNKRVLGWQSWHRRRKYIHRPDVLQALVSDIAQAEPDCIAVTGDIANISLPREFLCGRSWLETLGTPEKVMVIPGNHDAYVTMRWDEGLTHWMPYMQGDKAELFPSVRVRGEVALIGLSTAVPVPWFMASGRLGDEQLTALGDILEDLRKRDLFRLVMLHHPPAYARGGWRKALRDSSSLKALLKKTGAELVLHGHDHVPSLSKLAGPHGPISVLGVPSASAKPDRHGHGAAWNRYEIQRSKNGWLIGVRIRGVNADGATFTTRAQFDLITDP